MNKREFDDMNQISIPSYDIILDKLINKNQLSRTRIIIKSSLKYQVREDLTNKEDSHVAITLYLTKTQKINFHCWYRQFQELLPTGRIAGTKTLKAQKHRIITTSKYFQKSKTETEIYILSDLNINTKHLNTPENQKPTTEKIQSPITKIFKEQIIEQGFTILNKDNTKLNTKREIHIIDHIKTNKPQHNINTTTHNKHYSDHNQ